jgi:hypothetical protein
MESIEQSQIVILPSLGHSPFLEVGFFQNSRLSCARENAEDFPMRHSDDCFIKWRRFLLNWLNWVRGLPALRVRLKPA